MDLKQILKQIRIDVITNTVFISCKYFQFNYTPIDKEKVKEKYQKTYRYLGGLQSEYEHNSKEYNKLEDKLIVIAEKVLEGMVC